MDPSRDLPSLLPPDPLVLIAYTGFAVFLTVVAVSLFATSRTIYHPDIRRVFVTLSEFAAVSCLGAWVQISGAVGEANTNTVATALLAVCAIDIALAARTALAMQRLREVFSRKVYIERKITGAAGRLRAAANDISDRTPIAISDPGPIPQRSARV